LAIYQSQMIRFHLMDTVVKALIVVVALLFGENGAGQAAWSIQASERKKAENWLGKPYWIGGPVLGLTPLPTFS
jgi:hypothetical protein